MKRLPANWWIFWLVRARTRLVQHSALLNSINVFPVPDADTGANLVATVGRAADAAGMADDPNFAAAARTALRGARGNSGTLVSVWLLGLATELESVQEPTAAQLSAAWVAAHERAHAALNQPAEGTVLTLTAALTQVQVTEDLDIYLPALLEAAEAATRSTATADHARNGWVDAGALGVLLMVEQLVSTALNQPVTDSYADLLQPPATDVQATARGLRPGKKGEPTCEVMCEIHLPVYEVTQLRSALSQVGDSVSVAQVEAGNEALWAIHVHVAHQQDALDVLQAAGQPLNLRVTSLTAGDHPHHTSPAHPANDLS
ncbi:MAG: DAK2 domain-containing protein [Rothia sp. (in: high G+C Gram-positive bacteria)]|nr:DAK2 domain-containing protein [Rothia sp. (in: high G+C Gram-positive bacteria)]